MTRLDWALRPTVRAFGRPGGDAGGDALQPHHGLQGWERTPFHISRNELEVAEERREHWQWNFARDPRAFEIRPPLDAHVTLTATSFQANFH